MPVLIVYGMPTEVVGSLEPLLNQLQSKVGDVLGLRPDQIFVFFPSDLVQRGLGEELVCVVEGLFIKTTNPDEIAKCGQQLWEWIRFSLRDFATKHLQQCKKIVVIIKPFNQGRHGEAHFAITPQV